MQSFPKDGVADVRPEFLQDVENAVERNLAHPFLSRLGPGAFPAGVIKVGNPGAGTVADDLGEVEGLTAGIGSGDEQAANGVTRALEKSAVEEQLRIGWGQIQSKLMEMLYLLCSLNNGIFII